MNRSVMKFCSRTLMLSMLSMSFWLPSAQAGMISSEQVVSAQAAQQSRDHLRALIDRADVRTQLQAHGVDADAARARVDALTDEEVASINGQLDQLPAGGDIVGAVVFVFLVLLVTDLLGLTKVFPFTKPINR